MASNYFRYFSRPFALDSLDTSLTELTIAAYSGNEPSLTCLSFSDFPHLKTLTVCSYAFSYVKTFSIRDCDALESIVIGKNAFLASEFECPEACFTISHCISITEVLFAYYACKSYGHFAISGMHSLLF